MKRATLHVAFAAVALLSAGVAAYEAMGFVRAARIDRDLAAIGAYAAAHRSTAGGIEPAAVDRRDAGSVHTAALHAASVGDEPRQITLARAVTLAAEGHFAAAGRLYEWVLDAGPLDEIGRAALFDLGNAYLRQGAGPMIDAPRSLPMIEQAKARYRALLRVAPGDWDARYNLERALRLAPEGAADLDAASGTTKHDIRLRGARSDDLP